MGMLPESGRQFIKSTKYAAEKRLCPCAGKGGASKPSQTCVDLHYHPDGRSFSKWNPAAPIFYLTMIMPWPTCTWTTSLMGTFSSLFAVNCFQSEIGMIRYKHTLPSHAMPRQPCLTLNCPGKARERTRVWGKVLHPNLLRRVLTPTAIRMSCSFSKWNPVAPYFSFNHSPHTRARSPRFAKPRQGMARMAWHRLVRCACALLSLSHLGGDLLKKVS